MACQASLRGLLLAVTTERGVVVVRDCDLNLGRGFVPRSHGLDPAIEQRLGGQLRLLEFELRLWRLFVFYLRVDKLDQFCLGGLWWSLLAGGRYGLAGFLSGCVGDCCV